MKVMHKKTIEEKMDPVFTALIRQELGVLEMLDHPHLVRVLDLCEDEDNHPIVSIEILYRLGVQKRGQRVHRLADVPEVPPPIRCEAADCALIGSVANLRICAIVPIRS